MFKIEITRGKSPRSPGHLSAAQKAQGNPSIEPFKLQTWNDEDIDPSPLSPSSTVLMSARCADLPSSIHTGLSREDFPSGIHTGLSHDGALWRDIASENSDYSRGPTTGDLNSFIEQQSFPPLYDLNSAQEMTASWVSKKSAPPLPVTPCGNTGSGQESNCQHERAIDEQLKTVMGYPRYFESHAVSLSDARDGVARLMTISGCEKCTTSYKSMALVFIIANGLVDQLFYLSSVKSLMDKDGDELVHFNLGDYRTDSPDECLSIYLHAVRFQQNTLAAAINCFSQRAQSTGWIAHSDSWRNLATDLRLQ